MKRLRFSIYAAVLMLAGIAGQLSYGQDNSVTPRIVGGTTAAQNAWPSTVSLVFSGAVSFAGHFCAGTVVHRDWVLTAAHCVAGIRPGQIRVLTGVTNLLTDTPAEIIAVTQIIRHPGYNRVTFDFDFALLKLETRTGAARSRLYAGDSSLTGRLSTAVGWGTTSPYGTSLSPELMQVNLPIVSNVLCASANNSATTGSMLCAGRASGGVDACIGDSGGPLFLSQSGFITQAGVTSFGLGACAQAGSYGVWARVSAGIPFIALHVPGKISPDGLFFVAEESFAGVIPGISILLN